MRSWPNTPTKIVSVWLVSSESRNHLLELATQPLGLFMASVAARQVLLRAVAAGVSGLLVVSHVVIHGREASDEPAVFSHHVPSRRARTGTSNTRDLPHFTQ